MPKFQAKMEHTDATIRKLSKVQFNHEYGWIKRLLILVALGFIAYFIYVGGSKGLVPLIISCFMLSWVNAPAKRNAEEALRQLNGKYPKTRYLFYEDRMCYGERNAKASTYYELDYANVNAILEDIAWLYVISKNGIYMMEKSSFGDIQWADFKSFIEDACDISMKRTNGFNMLTKRDINKFIQKVKGKR